jgi:ACS family hexuronate transporter-like MFS transporter
MAPAMSATTGGIGDKIRGAMAVGKTRWGMLALVFFATTLNYIDRAALGVMQPILAKEMSWTAMDYANINFWFQVGYAIGFVLQGRLIDRVGVKRVFFCAVLLWSLATGAHGLATSAVGFMVCRFILGLTEAANYPACVKTTRLWFPAGERAVATGIFNAGTNVGAMFTPMLLPLILHVWGWQAAFLCMSALGGIWLLFWGLKYFNPEDHPSVKQSELDYIQKEVEPEQPRVPFSYPAHARHLGLRPRLLDDRAGVLVLPVLAAAVSQPAIQPGHQRDPDGYPADHHLPDGRLRQRRWRDSVVVPDRPRHEPIKARLLSMFLFACCIIGVIMAAGSSNLWVAVRPSPWPSARTRPGPRTSGAW